jgi:hypothetical protein
MFWLLRHEALEKPKEHIMNNNIFRKEIVSLVEKTLGLKIKESAKPLIELNVLTNFRCQNASV